MSPGDQRVEHHELLLRPRLRLPARVQHLLLDVQDRQPVPQAGHLSQQRRHLPDARLQHPPHALLGARRRWHGVHGRADAARYRRRADRRRAPHRGDVRQRRHHQALQRVFGQQVSVRLGVQLRQHRRGGCLHGGQAEQQHGGAEQGERQDTGLPGAGAGLVLLRGSGHAERRELVAVPVHRRAGRSGHGRLRPHPVDHARARRAAVVRRQARQHQRHQLGADRPQTPPTSARSAGPTRR